MKHALFWLVLYLACAELIEFAVLPQVRLVLPALWSGLLDLKLLAMSGQLAALAMGTLPGIVVALVAAALSGFSQLPGHWGASIVGFVTAAWLMGTAVEALRPKRLSARSALLFGVLLAGQALADAVRAVFWRIPMDVPWLGLLATAAVGTALLALPPGQRLRARPPRPDEATPSSARWTG